MKIWSLFRSKSESKPLKLVNTFVVYLNNEGFRYVTMILNKEEGPPFIVSKSGFISYNEYSDKQSWLAEVKLQTKQSYTVGMRVVCLLDKHDYSVYQTTNIETEKYEDKVAAMQWRLKELNGEEPEGFKIELVAMSDGGGKLTDQVLLVAARQEKLNILMETYKQIGLHIDCFQIQEVAISILGHRNLIDTPSVATLYVDTDDFLISIAQNGMLLMHRRIAREVLDDTSSPNSVSLRLVGEVVRSMVRVVRQFPDVEIGALLVDAGVDTKSYVEAFVEELDIHCEALTPYGVLYQEVDSSFFKNRLQLLVGAGVAVLDGQRDLKFQILTPPVSNGLNAKQFGIITASFAAIILMYGVYTFINNFYMQRQHEIERKAHMEKTSKTVQLSNASVSLEAKAHAESVLAALTQAHATLDMKSQNIAMSSWMETIATTIPAGVWLTDIKSDEGPVVLIKGLSMKNAEIADWVDKLNASTFLAGKTKFETLSVRQTDQSNAENYWEFEIKTRGVQP